MCLISAADLFGITGQVLLLCMGWLILLSHVLQLIAPCNGIVSHLSKFEASFLTLNLSRFEGSFYKVLCANYLVNFVFLKVYHQICIVECGQKHIFVLEESIGKFELRF